MTVFSPNRLLVMIAMGMRKAEQATNLLPMALWQYGLVTTEQLSQIFDWLEEFGPAAS